MRRLVVVGLLGAMVACTGVGKEGDIAVPAGNDSTSGGADVVQGDDVLPPLDAQAKPDSVMPETCGNGTCEKHEDPCSCALDCAGDMTCCQDSDCPQPQCGPCCTAVCVDFQCVDEWAEPCCGDGTCADGEDGCTCPVDCDLEPGTCCTDTDCPQPLCGPCCHATCQAGVCVDEWESPCCWNGECEAGEDMDNCPEDCTPLPGCGDGECSDSEDACTCPEDCPGVPECCDNADCPQPSCGPCCQSVCENNTCQPVWEAPCCWNGECEEGEDEKTCPEDCPPELTECEEKGGICAPWDPEYSQCPEGTGPVGLMCENKNQVCCQKEVGPGDCDFFKCATDDDCIKTNAGCCPCSSGGQSIAVAAECEAAWLKKLDCPPEVMCPDVYLCDDSYAACMGSQCVLLGGGGGGPW